MTANDEYVVEILESVGLITHQQSQDALAWAQKNDKTVIDALAITKVATKTDILKVLANQFGMEFISLSGLDIDQEVIDLVPGDVARRYKIIPLYKNENTITVALGDPLDVETLDSLRYVLRTGVEPNVATPEEIEAALNHYYPATGSTVNTLLQEMTEGTISAGDREAPNLEGEDEVTDADAPIIKLVNLVIVEAFKSRASDIHLEPLEKTFPRALPHRRRAARR